MFAQDTFERSYERGTGNNLTNSSRIGPVFCSRPPNPILPGSQHRFSSCFAGNVRSTTNNPTSHFAPRVTRAPTPNGNVATQVRPSSSCGQNARVSQFTPTAYGNPANRVRPSSSCGQIPRVTQVTPSAYGNVASPVRLSTSYGQNVQATPATSLRPRAPLSSIQVCYFKIHF